MELFMLHHKVGPSLQPRAEQPTPHGGCSCVLNGVELVVLALAGLGPCMRSVTVHPSLLHASQQCWWQPLAPAPCLAPAANPPLPS